MDLLVRGGTVVTMNDANEVLEADVLIRGERIHAIGPSLAFDRPVRVVDARGCAVLPGFVQAHVHLCQALFRGFGDDLPLLEWLKQRIWPLEAAHDEASIAASADLGLAEMTLAGTTAILDMGTVRCQDAVFDSIATSRITALSGKAMMDTGDGVPAGLRETTQESLDESLRLFSRWNGANDGRIGYAYAPRFILSCSEELLRSTASLAKEQGAIVHSHAAEHADERVAVKTAIGMDDLAALEAYGIAGERTVLAHGVQLRDDEMKRCAELGTRFVHCPSANLKLASGIADVMAMRRHGMLVGIGADGAPCNNRMDPLTEVRSAALLAKAKTGDAAALCARDALSLLTRDGARVLGLDETGVLAIGKRADVAVVRIDSLHEVPGGDAISRVVYASTAADVEHVIARGELVVHRREHRVFDVARVRAIAREQAALVAARAGLR
jgi:5-methylthioadenosine/S-adenosylhomocysteine deaminase